jgi:predicted transcriptional regulator
MTVSFKAKISVPGQVLVRTFQDESVLLNLASECYHGLDDMGTSMWQTLIQSENIQAAYEKLLSEYDVDEVTLQKDLEMFIERLVERGLVEVIDRQSA